MKITAINKSGKEVWRVYLGTFNGKKRYKQFKTKGEAELFLRNENIRRKSHGRISADIDPARIVEWMELDEMVNKAGGTLREAALAFVRKIKASDNSIPLSKAVEQYISAKQVELSPYTMSDRRRRLRTFADAVPDLLACEVDPKPFLEKLATRTSRTNADNSRRSISAFYTWAINSGFAEENPIRKIGSFGSKKNGVATVLSPDETATLLETVQKEFNAEVASFIILSLFAGIRPMEFRKRIRKNGKLSTVTLNWEDLMDGNIRISSDLAKTGSPRLVPINDTLSIWLDWLKSKVSGNTRGPIVGSRFKFAWADWKNEHASDFPWSAKDILRHTYGTYRVSQAQEIGKVAIEMGNSEGIVKKHYWDALRSQKEATAFWAIHPED